jgi:hypothetical protein
VSEQSVVIWSGEHRAYWRAWCSGYTSDLASAGVYPRSVAERAIGGCGPEKRVKIFPVRLIQISVPYLIDRRGAPESVP